MPNLTRLGLAAAAEASTGRALAVAKPAGPVTGAWGYAIEHSAGKDTPAVIGKWPRAGDGRLGLLPQANPDLPKALTDVLRTQLIVMSGARCMHRSNRTNRAWCGAHRSAPWEGRDLPGK